MWHDIWIILSEFTTYYRIWSRRSRESTRIFDKLLEQTETNISIMHRILTAFFLTLATIYTVSPAPNCSLPDTMATAQGIVGERQESRDSSIVVEWGIGNVSLFPYHINMFGYRYETAFYLLGNKAKSNITNGEKY